MLDTQRLKIQLVAHGVIGGNRLGVVVYDYGLVPRFLYGPDGVDGGEVKLNSLAYPDGARAQDYDRLFVGDPGLVFFLVCRVEIGDIAFKLAGAGVDHLIDRHNALFFAKLEHLLFALAPELTYEPVGNAHLLGHSEDFDVHGVIFKLFFTGDYVLYLVDKEEIYLGGLAYKHGIDAAP